MRGDKSQTEQVNPAPVVGNGLDNIETPSSVEPERADKLNKVVSLAATLLRPNPATLAVARGEQQVVPIVKTLGTSEFFRTHSTLRFTLDMVAPNKGAMDDDDFAYLPEAEGEIARHSLKRFPATLYPVVVFGTQLVYKLVKIKHPPPGRKWDIWNQSRALVLEQAVDVWLSMRASDGGGYQSFLPESPEKYPADPTFPKWDADEWLLRSLERGGLLIKDASHHVFKPLRGL